MRLPFYFKHATLAVALERGIKFEICYGTGILNSDGGASRRNLISNATQLIRATRGRGIVVSSEAKKALACRGPADVINMAVLWGLGQEKGAEAIGREPRSAVMQAELKRRSHGGVVDVVYGGEKPEGSALDDKGANSKQGKGKRKAEVLESRIPEGDVSPKPTSKREQKRQAKKARLEIAGTHQGETESTPKDSAAP
jgi:ribonuclease P/MRP protein subunit RPP1